MTYALFSDIQSEFKDVDFSAAGVKVTAAEVTGFIAQEEATINAAISKLYVIPVVDADDILIVKSISIKCVKARVSTILETKSPSIETDQQPAWMIMYREAKATLKRIATGVMPLPNTPTVETGGGVSAYDYSAEADENLPVFKRGIRQW